MSTRFTELFPNHKPLIGVIHLHPLPGSPNYRGSMTTVIDHALRDTEALKNGGIDGIIIENYGDYPFYPAQVEPHTIAAMTRVTLAVKAIAETIPIGINVLRNDAQAALAIAAMTHSQFIRVNVHTGAMVADQGILQGKAHQTLRYRNQLDANNVAILADVMVKHAFPIGSMDLVTIAKDTFLRGMADALIITGSGTGQSTNLDHVQDIKLVLPQAPVLVGSGVNPNTARDTFAIADGAIVGTALKIDGITLNPVDQTRVRQLKQAVKN